MKEVDELNWIHLARWMTGEAQEANVTAIEKLLQTDPLLNQIVNALKSEENNREEVDTISAFIKIQERITRDGCN